MIQQDARATAADDILVGEAAMMTQRGVNRWGVVGRLILGGAVVAGLAGCAGDAPSGGAAGTYDCMGTPIPVAAITDPRPATELGEHGSAALRGLEVPEIDPAEWIIVSEDAERVVLLRELPTPEDLGAGDVRTHERMVISIVDAPNIPNTPAWMMSALGTCALAVDSPGAGSATVTLDPDGLPDPASAEVPLLVTELACNSGEDAAGRIELTSLRETDEVVEVVLAVRPRGGGQDCQSNPPTPFTVTLEGPLGDRLLLDASVTPARPIGMPARQE